MFQNGAATDYNVSLAFKNRDNKLGDVVAAVLIVGIGVDEDIRTVTRTIHSRVLLNYHTARSVLEWLEEKIEMLEMEDGANPLMVDDDSGVEQ